MSEFFDQSQNSEIKVKILWFWFCVRISHSPFFSFSIVPILSIVLVKVFLLAEFWTVAAGLSHSADRRFPADSLPTPGQLWKRVKTSWWLYRVGSSRSDLCLSLGFCGWQRQSGGGPWTFPMGRRDTDECQWVNFDISFTSAAHTNSLWDVFCEKPMWKWVREYKLRGVKERSQSTNSQGN